MKNYIQKIKNKIKTLDKIAQNPFIDCMHKYNPSSNYFTQTYVWIEEDNKKNLFGSITMTNPLKGNDRLNNQKF